MGKEDKSLLELAVEYIEKCDGPQPIHEIIDSVLEQKGVKKADFEDAKAQLIVDFMLSGNFVCVKDDEWDLKYRQPMSILDKDGGDLQKDSEDAKEAEKNELKETDIYAQEGDEIEIEDNRDDDDEADNDYDDDSLENEFDDEDFDNITDDLEEYEEE